MAKSSSPAADLDKVIIRLPDGMRDKLKDLAKINDRSVNAEIVQRLKQSLAEGSADLVKLDLPGDVWNMLMADASMNNKSMEERAIELLQNNYNQNSEYNQSIEKLLDLANENNELYDKIDRLQELLQIAEKRSQNASSLDEIMTMYLKKFVDAPFVAGSVDRFTEQYSKAKKEEQNQIRRLISLADSLLEEAYSRIPENLSLSLNNDNREEE